jgi:tRNA G10  N-methylase Trm11
MEYLFALGNHADLSVAEILTVCATNGSAVMIVYKDSQHLILSGNILNPEQLIIRLGGTKKIGHALESQGALTSTIIHHLAATEPERKIHFSLSGDVPKQLPLAVKKALKSRGRSVRYVPAKNTATIVHNNLVKRQADLTVINKTLFVTDAVQPIEAYGDRDYGKPARDPKSGMLPPKLAQIMINIAGIKPERKTLLDPFCGSGTVLMEAALTHFDTVIGSDMSDKAIEDSTTNMTWLKEQYHTTTHSNLLTSDVRVLDKKLPAKSIDVIVTEPYLGEPLGGNHTASVIDTQVQELSALYLDAFRAWKHLLKKKGVVVMVIPAFRINDTFVPVNIIESVVQLGFTVVPLDTKSPSLRYWRKGQHVGRDIWKFEYKG